MPREASKRNNWEKERRERFNKGFEELAKILPSYDPTINISRVDILKEATNTISQLREDIDKIPKSTEDNKTYKDDLIKKLQERIKKLLVRNEQLVRLFRDAGIKLPRVVGSVKKFNRRFQWSNKVLSSQQNVSKTKSKAEKENASSTSQANTKIQKLVSTGQGVKPAKTINNQVKPPVPRKFYRKIPVSNNLMLFSRLPPVPTFNQHFVLVPNPTVVNSPRTTVVSAPSRKIKFRKSTQPLTVPRINPALANLIPGTIILANGNMISVGSQPQIVLPPISVPPRPVANPNLPKTLPKSTGGINNIDFKKNCAIRSKSCITKTTQVNKVPIPALTSKYANTSLLLKDQISKDGKLHKSENHKTNHHVGVKRKSEENDCKIPKKIQKCENCERKDDSNKGENDIPDAKKSENMEKTNLKTPPVDKIITPASSVTVAASSNITATTSSSETITTAADRIVTETSNVTVAKSTDVLSNICDTVPICKPQAATTSSDNNSTPKENAPQKVVLNKTDESDSNLPTLDEIAEKPFQSVSKSTRTEILEKPEDATADTLTTSSVSATTSTYTSHSSVVSCSALPITTISTSVHEDSMKNIDLNLVHSDLSNDIFASLQVPPGCQNMESTSPTAAFLLAFPLVSSIKVTEVIDEDNSDSQRETPTLLQIGGMDASKPSHNDALLNLDNFSFFNSKEMCGNYYNSKLEVNNSDYNRTPEKSCETKEMVPQENSKSKNSDYIYTEDNGPVSVKEANGSKVNYKLFPKSESQTILENRIPSDQSSELFEKSQNTRDNQNTTRDNGRYMLYEQKPKDTDTGMFSQPDSTTIKANNFQTSSIGLPPTLQEKHNFPCKVTNTGTYDTIVQNKLQSSCNMLSSTMNIDYNIPHGNICKEPAVSNTNNCSLPDNVSYKESQKNLGKMIDSEDRPSNQIFNEDGNSGKMTKSPKQFVPTEHHLNTVAVSSGKMSLETSSDAAKVRETYNFHPKQFSQNDQQSLIAYPPHSAKISEGQNENLVKSSSAKETCQYSLKSANVSEGSDQNLKTYDCNPKRFVSHHEHYNLDSFLANAAKISEETVEKGNTVKPYQYTKQFVPNEQHNLTSFANNSSKNSEGTGQNVEKSDLSKTYYHSKQFLQNDQHTVTSFLTKPSEETVQSLTKSEPNKMYHYNQKQFVQNEKQTLNTFPHNSVKLSEGTGQNLEKSDVNIIQYHPKQFVQSEQYVSTNSANISKGPGRNANQFVQNEQHIFASNSAKILEGTGQHLEKANASKYLYHPKQFLQNEQHTVDNFPPNSTKLSEETVHSVKKSEATKMYHYNQKQFVQNEKQAFPPNSAKLSEEINQQLEKSDANKTYQFNPKQFLPNEQHSLNNFPHSATKISEDAGKRLEKADSNKTYHYHSKQYVQNEQHTVNTFLPNTLKIEELGQNLEKSDATKTYQYNPKQFVQNEQHAVNMFPPISSKISESPGQNLQKSGATKPCHYNVKHFVQNEQHSINAFSSNSKIREGSGQILEESDEHKAYQYNPKQFLQNNFPPRAGKISEGAGQNVEKADASKIYHYHPKQFVRNEQHAINAFLPNSSKIPEGTGQNVDKPDATKTYQYNAKQFVQNDQHAVNTFPGNSSGIPREASGQNLEKSDPTKTYHYNQKQFVHNEHLNNFLPNSAKGPEGTGQNLDKAETTKAYQYNPFEVVQTSKEMPLAVGNNRGNADKERQKISDSSKRIDEVSAKPADEKACYFMANYSNTAPKICVTCSYENTNRNYTNPFYTNCNYTHNYSEPNFNQNYCKTEGKSCYSLNYENYQEYKKTDSSFARDKRNSAPKEKVAVQNKPVNWMTTEQKSQTSDCFLPSFTNQSYSFTSCVSTDTNDNNFGDIKKTADLTDKRFTWSPSKLPNFLEPNHNFITPTLPTLVGDLALGNALPLAEPKIDYRYPKDIKRKTYDNQANFLSVSQLVNQTKTDTTPARTGARRLSGSKSKNAAPSKKRFDKNADKNPKPNNYTDVFFDQKNRSATKNISTNYSAEALIGNQCPQEDRKFSQNTNKLCSSNFLTENIVTYFTTVDDSYMNQNQNFHTYTHNSFQNNSYPTNSFIYTTPISSSYLPNTFDGTSDYSAEGIMNYCGLKDNKNGNNKNYRPPAKEEKNPSYASNVKKTNKKANQSNNTGLGNFEFPLLAIQGSTNSPILPDDFQSHSTFLPPTAPYTCKNSLYPKQGGEFNGAPLLPLPGITRTNIQHPEVSPSLNPVGTSLTNFNLSTIFPEINKGTISNLNSNSNKSKNSSSYLDVPFNGESKYGFTG